jgi:ABC-type lipoprotein export system ATPase subunit
MINVRQLSKTYETPGEAIQVLDRLDLTLAAGETAAIVGPSGSGKSTLLNLLGALDRPTSGTITIGDQDISTFSEEQAAAFRNHSLGFIFQQQHLQFYYLCLMLHPLHS